MKRIIFLFLTFVHVALFSQSLQLKFEKSFTPNFFDYFLSAADKQFYLSDDGIRMMINSDLKYQIFSTENGELVGEGEHVKKQNAGIASLFGILKNRSFNREDAIEKARFDEGTEYLVFQEEGLIIMLDWNKDENVIKALDLKTGELKWKTDRYRYSSSSKSQYVDLILGVANAGRLQRNTPRDIAYNNARLQGFGEGGIPNQDASPAARGFITPMSGSGSFLMRVQEKYVAIDLQTGTEKWVYDQRKINIGFSEMANDGNLIIVNFTSSYLKANQRLIIKLDPQTGKEIWTAEHISDFREGRTFLHQDRLICDYYGAEVFDLKTGQRVLLSISEKTIKTQNAMTSMFMSDASGGRGTQSIASPSFVEGNFLYTSVFKLGKRIYANDGSSKAMVHKYNLQTGAKIWESNKLPIGTDLSLATEDFVFVRQGKAMGKSALLVLDPKSGEVIAETDNIEGFIYRAGATDMLAGEYLFRSGKKNIYSFSTQNWKLSETYKSKDLLVGKIQALLPADNDLAVIGDKGMNFLSGGKMIHAGSVRSSFWNSDYCVLFLNNQTVIVNLKTNQEVGRLDFAPNEDTIVLFSQNTNTLMVVKEKKNLLVYTF